MSTLSKLIVRVNAISTEISAGFFVEIVKLILKLIWKSKRPKIAKTILKKIKVGRVTPPDVRTIIKLVWYWLEHRHIGDRIES